MKYDEKEVEDIIDVRKEVDKHIEETYNYLKDKNEERRIYLILSKYVTEFSSLEIRIGKLLNKPYLYTVVNNGYYEFIFNAIDLLIKEKELYIKLYSNQADEFNNYINCLNEYKKIIDATVENGFSYYDNLVMSNGNELESNSLINVVNIE